MLRVRNIDVYYGDVQALWEVSLEVNEGQIVALVGSNGAGKTTTVRAISGLQPPRAGSIEFLGHRIDQLPSHRVVEMGIAHVPEGRKLFPDMTVLENLLLGACTSRGKRQQRVSLEFVLEKFPILKDRRNQLAGTLSGGEQQMLTIGRGLMASPLLLILDEPSLGLAPLLIDEVFNTIIALRSEGLTVLLIEQHVDRALLVADQAYVLENGRLSISGPGSQLLESKHVKQAYLGTL